MNLLVRKVDLFMKLHVLPHFKPDDIHWVFSISGGKDSFVMCESIREWYEIHGHTLRALGLYIWQWGEEDPSNFLKNTLPWIPNIEVIDARVYTTSCLGTGTHQQAQCRSCADIRHYFSDMYLGRLKADGPFFLCRGLHFTDMTISILWRFIWYGLGDRLDGKGKPIAPLAKNIFLAKPLCFAREYECQVYAKQKNYIPLHCDCPAQIYPSRRDIVEESIRQFYASPLWEFDIPGSSYYLQNTAGLPDVIQLKEISAHGRETKRNIIPDAYYTFARDYFLQMPHDSMPNQMEVLLETFSSDYLCSGSYGILDRYNGGCKLLSEPDSLSSFDLRMIGTLGPFWAAVSLPHRQREYFFRLQQQVWKFVPDSNWSQVYSLLKLYYEDRA